MKQIVKTTLAVAFALAAFAATAQNHMEDPRYGATPEQREENLKRLNFLRDEVQARNWNEAATFVKPLIHEAPEIHGNLYIWGATTYKQKAARARSVADKKIFVDSVMMIYDLRARYFGGSGERGTPYILHLKARDYLTLNPLDGTGVRKFYKDAVAAGGANVSGEVVVEYFQQLVNGFKGFEIEATDLLIEYERLAPMMEAASAEDRDKFNTLFAASGAANCDVLEKLYTEELKADPENVDVLTKAYNLMTMVDCSSDFYVQVAEKYYAKVPSTPVAIRMAMVFENRHEYDRALKYLNAIVGSEQDSATKANLYVRIAASELGAGRASAAGAAAKSAIALSPDNGNAHFILASAYMAGTSGCSGFNAQSVFWLAYDELARAKTSFAGDANMSAQIDSSMANCRANFPATEEMFMYGVTNGQSHYVSCGWVSGSTTARSR